MFGAWVRARGGGPLRYTGRPGYAFGGLIGEAQVSQEDLGQCQVITPIYLRFGSFAYNWWRRQYGSRERPADSESVLRGAGSRVLDEGTATEYINRQGIITIALPRG